MAKVPGCAAHPKAEPMHMMDGRGVGDTEAPMPPIFPNDHQLPVPDEGTARMDEKGLPIFTAEEIKGLKGRGDIIEFPGTRPDGSRRRF